MIINYIIILLLSVLLTAGLSFLIIKTAKKFKIVDKPGPERKIHTSEIPLSGGVSIFLVFFIILYFFRDSVLAGNLEVSHWLGVFAGAFILMVGGLLDDKYNLKPIQQIIFPILASACVIAGGVEIEKITNPFGGFFYFSSLVSAGLIFLWLIGMMYTTKLLDGIDGLVAGVTAIGGIIIFLFTMTTRYYQPDIGLAALVLAGAALGFLVFNWHPAKIFLGEGGSLLLGFILGVLAIISGGKIAIALLVMGIPILDVFWTIIKRLRERKNPFKFADRNHLHYKLYDLGIGQRGVAIIYYCLALSFGLCALFLQSRGKAAALGILLIVMFIIVISINRFDRKKI